MTFLWPELLWLLLGIPVVVAAYVLLLLRARKAALRYAHLSLIKEAMGAGGRVRRHVPPLLFLLALAAMLVAIARPAGIVLLPSQKQTLILAMDVSGSMRARDVLPSRLEAAQAAVRAFIAELFWIWLETLANAPLTLLSATSMAACLRIPPAQDSRSCAARSDTARFPLSGMSVPQV